MVAAALCPIGNCVIAGNWFNPAAFYALFGICTLICCSQQSQIKSRRLPEHFKVLLDSSTAWRWPFTCCCSLCAQFLPR